MKTDLNFYASYRATNKQLTLKSRITSLITILIIVMIAAIAGTTLTLVGLNAKDKHTINTLNSEIRTQQELADQVTVMTAELATVQKKADAIKDVDVTTMLARMLSKEEINMVYGAMTKDTVIKGATYSNATLVLSCSAASKDSPSKCAENLAKVGITAGIGYSGFGVAKGDKAPAAAAPPKDGETATIEAPSGVDFTLSCKLGYDEELTKVITKAQADKVAAEKAAAEKAAAEAAASETSEGGDE